MKRLWLILPLALFAVFLGVAGYQLTQPKDEFVRSTMIGKPLPAFDLPGATDEAPRVASASFADGQPRLLNVWATWCVPCIAEAPQLEELAERGVPIVGVAIRDEPEAIARFLENYGNPYEVIARDDIAELQLGLGSSGIPETFVVDGDGIIRYQHIGDIRADDVDEIYAAWEDAR
ncbi:DsbE family thiol:disulfide interchange protein [Citromicrobium sp. JLT1363]|uniref:DsbE family thiol:disulfide interchange protein n=1 Tax=Citromicrobium sp. JLT1363 TaxID=517722 RepID=UPI000225DF6F|nr:DsbE family thiol:disulfide interchange protein [Citromicrobium sp. JLT1363]